MLGSSLVSGHAGLDLEQRRDLVRRGDIRECRRRAAPVCHCRRSQPCRDPVDFLAGQLLAGADLVDHVRRLRQERVVAELAGGAGKLFLRGGQILLQPAPLGGDVDGARRVQFDHDRAARQPHLERGDGLKPSRQVSATPARSPPGPGVEICGRDVRQPRGHLLRSFSPWSLRNRRTSVTSFCMSVIVASQRIQREAGRRRPVRDDQRLATGQRLPQRLGDERHHRMQQLEQQCPGPRPARRWCGKSRPPAALSQARRTSRRTRPRRSGTAIRRPG